MTNADEAMPKPVLQPIPVNAPGTEDTHDDRDGTVGVQDEEKTDISRNIETLSTEWQRENVSEQSVLTPERAAEGDRDHSDAV